MMLSRRKAEVRHARAAVRQARRRLRAPLRVIGRDIGRHPLPWLCAAAGVGACLGFTRQRAWRIPGFVRLLSGEIWDMAAVWMAAAGQDGQSDTPSP